jgi:DNA-binding CsgD family transcriptional regulator
MVPWRWGTRHSPVQMSSMHAPSDLVEVVEAVYREAEDEILWLRGIAHAAKPALDAGLGVGAWMYDTSHGVFEVTASTGIGAPQDVFRRFEAAIAGLPSKELIRCYRSSAATTMSAELGRSPLDLPPLAHHIGPISARDIVRVTLADASGRGCGIGALLPDERRLGVAERGRLGDLAAHLLAGYRLRQRQAPIEAVIDTAGKVVHAEPAAQSKKARDVLREAAIAIDRARGKLRREDPDLALKQWRSLVEGRWSIVDLVERDGRRYLVARENTPATPRVSGLTPRETQIAARVAAGHSLKLIALELGVVHSTVTAHLERALKKLGLASRYELSTVLAPWADCWADEARAGTPAEARRKAV